MSFPIFYILLTILHLSLITIAVLNYAYTCMFFNFIMYLFDVYNISTFKYRFYWDKIIHT